MQTLLSERSGAQSIALTERGRESALETPASKVDPGVLGWKLRSSAPTESATLEESTQSRMSTATGPDCSEEKTPAPEAPKATCLSKSEFILGLPMGLSAREVVAGAREQGMTISEPYVYKVRYDAMAAPEPASAATTVTVQTDPAPKAGLVNCLPVEVSRAEAPATAEYVTGLAEDSEGEASAATAPEAAKKTPFNKSKFVRGLPMDLSPKEVVARAREQGITIDRTYVKGIRAAARARALRTAPATPAAPTTPASAKLTPMSATQSKSDFIRSLPSSVSYAEAATKAKAVGILFSASHFYAVMSQVKRDAQAALKSEPVRTPIEQVTSAPAPGGLKLASDDAHEQALIDVVRALGLSRSRAVIDLMETVERVANAAR